jgi:hypothetical protein
MAVCTLLRHPEVATTLGRRGHSRLARIFDESACVDGYRELLFAAAWTPEAELRTAVGV